MSVLVCKKCGMPWEECGNTYERKDKKKTDHYCSNCGSKKKPAEVSVSEKRFFKSVRVKESLRLNSLDKFELPDGVVIEEKKPKGTLAGLENDEHFDWSPYYEGPTFSFNILPPKPVVLEIPDLHAPFMHRDAVDFLNDTYKKHQCNTVVLLGDEIDNHYSSFHEADPDGYSANKELKLAAKQLSEVAKAFPNAKVCIGNHTAIPQRKAYNAGLSSRWVKTVRDVLLELGVPCSGWEYADKWDINGVRYTHGTGRKAKQRMIQDGISTCQGHYHVESYIYFHVNEVQKIFAKQIGALIDDDAYAFAYSKYFAKSHKNAGVTIDGVPIIEYMDLGSKVLTL